MLERELQLERSLFFFLNGSESTLMDHFMWLYSYMFTWIPFYICFLLVFIYKKNWKEILLVFVILGLLVLVCDQLSSGFFKPVFHRFRPTHHPDFKDQVETVLNYRGGLYGFISGHAANSFGFATLTALLFRNKAFSIMIFCFAIITAYSRVYLGVHFISDIVVGALVGALAGLLIYEIYIKCRQFILKVPIRKIRKSIYTPKQAHFLVGVYVVILLVLLIFNNQLINLLG